MYQLKKPPYKKYILINIFIGLIFTGFMLLYSQNFTLIGYLDAVFIAGMLLFTFGWFFFISNHGLFDIIIYGVQAFWKGVFGKKMEKDYISYTTEKSPVPKAIFLSLWLTSLIFFFATFILYLFYWQSK